MFEQAEMFRADLKTAITQKRQCTDRAHTHILGALILVCVCVCRNYDTRDFFFLISFPNKWCRGVVAPGERRPLL